MRVLTCVKCVNTVWVDVILPDEIEDDAIEEYIFENCYDDIVEAMG